MEKGSKKREKKARSRTFPRAGDKQRRRRRLELKVAAPRAPDL
jgi:hypothetical protein